MSSRGAAVESLADLAGKKLAVLKGDGHYRDFRDVIERFGLQCRFVEADDYETVLMLVDAGRCDAGIVSQYYGDFHRKRCAVVKSPIVFSPRDIYFAALKDHSSGLIDTIDNHLWKLKRSKHSTYHQARARWFNLQPEYHLPQWMSYLGAGIGIVTLALMLHGVVMPVIVGTGYSEQVTPAHIRSLGISGLLLKPLVLRDLSQEVRRALDECRAFFN